MDQNGSGLVAPRLRGSQQASPKRLAPSWQVIVFAAGPSKGCEHHLIRACRWRLPRPAWPNYRRSGRARRGAGYSSPHGREVLLSPLSGFRGWSWGRLGATVNVGLSLAPPSGARPDAGSVPISTRLGDPPAPARQSEAAAAMGRLVPAFASAPCHGPGPLSRFCAAGDGGRPSGSPGSAAALAVQQKKRQGAGASGPACAPRRRPAAVACSSGPWQWQCPTGALLRNAPQERPSGAVSSGPAGRPGNRSAAVIPTAWAGPGAAHHDALPAARTGYSASWQRYIGSLHGALDRGGRFAALNGHCSCCRETGRGLQGRLLPPSNNVWADFWRICGHAAIRGSHFR